MRTAEEWPDDVVLKFGEPGIKLIKNGEKVVDTILKIGDGVHNFNELPRTMPLVSQYLGTITEESFSNLEDTSHIKNGDFYRAGEEFTLFGNKTIYAADILLATKESPGKNEEDWNIIHTGYTWQENTKTQSGYVPAPNGEINKAWMTNEEGTPGWYNVTIPNADGLNAGLVRADEHNNIAINNGIITVNHATAADTAGKTENDSDGNKISTTYAKIDDLTNGAVTPKFAEGLKDTLPIEGGGTGATNAQDAKVNLEIVGKEIQQIEDVGGGDALYYYGTEDMIVGETPLPTGVLYFVYDEE